uniref:CSON008066 protein n=1 Tax=Culicoides sonorensis TaxID=179676 RepID=A0A336N0L6_CULSO
MAFCAFCEANDAAMTCSGCKSATYCSVEHQKSHWKTHKEECRAYKIFDDKMTGRYLVTTRDISADSFIMSESPLVVGPKWSLEEQDRLKPVIPCVGCFNPVPIYASTRCPVCNWPACSTKCEGLQNEKLHGLECGILAFGKSSYKNKEENPEVFLDFYRSDALFALKCLMLKIKKPKKWDELLKLNAYEMERKKSPFYEDANERVVKYLQRNFLDVVKNIEEKTGRKILTDYDSNTLQKICGIIELYSMLIPLSNGQELSGLFPTACLLKHSCIPNCSYTFNMTDGFKIKLTAGCDIKKGKVLTTSYTHILWGTFARREHLLQTRYTKCVCERCIDKTELGTYFSALRCFGTEIAHCNGIQLPNDPLDEKSDWSCDKCPITITTEHVLGLMSQMQDEVDSIIYNKDASVTSTETLIDKLSQFLHKNHYHLFALKHSLIQMYGHQKEYLLNQMSESTLERKIKMCHELLEVIQKLDPYAIRLALYTAIIFYELSSTLIELGQRRLKGTSSPEEKIKYAKLFDEAENFLKQGKNALKHEQNTAEGDKTLKQFNELDEKLQKILSVPII